MCRGREESSWFVSRFSKKISSNHTIFDRNFQIKEIAGIVFRIIAGGIKFDCVMAAIHVIKKFKKLIP